MSVFYISQVFSNGQSVLSQHNKQLMWPKTIKQFKFYLLHSDKAWVFDQSQCTQGPIYFMKENITYHLGEQEHCEFQETWPSSSALLLYLLPYSHM